MARTLQRHADTIILEAQAMIEYYKNPSITPSLKQVIEVCEDLKESGGIIPSRTVDTDDYERLKGVLRKALAGLQAAQRIPGLPAPQQKRLGKCYKDLWALSKDWYAAACRIIKTYRELVAASR